MRQGRLAGAAAERLPSPPATSSACGLRLGNRARLIRSIPGDAAGRLAGTPTPRAGTSIPFPHPDAQSPATRKTALSRSPLSFIHIPSFGMPQHRTTTGPETHADPGCAQLMARIILAAGFCPHPAVKETEDGHTCRICGRLVDSPTLS